MASMWMGDDLHVSVSIQSVVGATGGSIQIMGDERYDSLCMRVVHRVVVEQCLGPLGAGQVGF